MKTRASLAIVGDFDPGSRSHVATNDAIGHSAAALGVVVEPHWMSTAEAAGTGGRERLAEVDGLWIAPCSPYLSMDGALCAIRMARTGGIPSLGTCGGFQHMIVEYARNVLGIKDAEHEETAPDAPTLVISRLACSLVGRTMEIALDPGSRLARIYGGGPIQGEFICNFGVDPGMTERLRTGPLRVAASDAEGEVRAVELTDHLFFVGTLFLPQHRSTAARPDPLVTAFLGACCARAA